MLDRSLLQGLYVLTDEFLTPNETLLEQIERVLKSGVRILQYRNKNANEEEALRDCIRLQALCDYYEALFIVDDRLDVAYEMNADGLHVGMDDVGYEEARRRLGKDKIIGVSCYGDIERALHYEALGADYVAFGSFFPSPTKPHSNLVEPSFLEKAKKHLKVPICAIGGINQENIFQLHAYDLAMYSVISAVYKEDAIEKNIEAFHAQLK
ncbi:MAG: thiamine phosphate synthase [Campylobacterales bacterium]|nr:thiamine phosphate synthase [Campylobacterales bacterium]MBN2832706.1 thiamine phosphate synthase [Campylobacterales bacterium]